MDDEVQHSLLITTSYGYDKKAKLQFIFTDIVSSMRDMAEAQYSYRDTPPAHYTLKIDSFSKFLDALKADKEFYTSQIFEAGGYKWKLCLYPKGDKERNGEGYISMYLTIQDTETLPIGWEVNVVCKFFVLDQLRHKFLVIEDALKRTSRFNETKTEWGISKVLPCSDFEDNSNGFLIKDSCIFGAEIFVIPNTSVGECISPVKDFHDYTYKWEIQPFSSYIQQIIGRYDSAIFAAGNFKWKLLLYPRGNGVGTDNSLSLFLNIVGLDAQAKVYVEYKLCIQDQREARHRERKLINWFTSSSLALGYAKFLSLTELNDPSSGFLVKDTVIIEVQITNIFALKSASLF